MAFGRGWWWEETKSSSRSRSWLRVLQNFENRNEFLSSISVDNKDLTPVMNRILGNERLWEPVSTEKPCLAQFWGSGQGFHALLVTIHALTTGFYWFVSKSADFSQNRIVFSIFLDKKSCPHNRFLPGCVQILALKLNSDKEGMKTLSRASELSQIGLHIF